MPEPGSTESQTDHYPPAFPVTVSAPAPDNELPTGSDFLYRNRLLEVYAALREKTLANRTGTDGLLGPVPEWACKYRLDTRHLKKIPRLQAALVGITAYTPSKWLLEQELSARLLYPVGSKSNGPTWATETGEDVFTAAANAELAGIGLSGGGIRSATFCLGVLQAFAAAGKLEEFDYISSVSGGGYIHQWLASWSWNEEGGFSRVAKRLIPLPAPRSRARMPEQIIWLRRYASYLTPRRGVLSADSWTMATTWLRNTTLNQIILFSFFAVCLLLIRAAAWPFMAHSLNRPLAPSTIVGWVLLSALVLGLAFSVFRMSGALSSIDQSVSKVSSGASKKFTLPRGPLKDWQVLAYVIAPPMICAYLLALSPLYDRKRIALGPWLLPVIWAVYVCAALLAITFSGSNWQQDTRKGAVPRGWSRLRIALFVVSSVVWSLGSFSLASFMLQPVGLAQQQHGGWHIFLAWINDPNLTPGTPARIVCLAKDAARHLQISRPSFSPGCLFPGRSTHTLSFEFLLAIFGPAFFFFFQFLAVRLHVGMLGRSLPESHREWLARLGAWSAIASATWIVLGFICLVGPFVGDAFLSAHFPKKMLYGAGVVLLHAFTLYSGASSKTDGKRNPSSLLGYKPLDLVGMIGAPLCILVLLLITAAMFDVGSETGLLCCLFISGAVFALFGARVDVNKFSMAPFYRNRLARCYLGGNNPMRTPDPFTGFDEHEQAMQNTSMPLSYLLPARFNAKPVPMMDGSARTYDGPFPIFASTVTLTFGEDLAWQERKGASFAFTPLYSGYHVGWTAETGRSAKTSFNGFVPTSTFECDDGGGVDLPTVAAISGAALSPNSGFSSQPALAFLMTLFNVRLGWWIANPRKAAIWRKDGRRCTPVFGPLALLSELFGFATDTSRYVNLCDGGRFDNMGLYELVRRRCSRIVICDGEEDVNTTFEGIGLAVAKCRTDFGVEIELDLRDLQPARKTGHSKAHFCVGHIHYPAPPGGDPANIIYTGEIIYLKTTLCGNEPADILHYKRENPAFPQQSTINQWFTENQFESYRRLGELIGEEAATAFRVRKAQPEGSDRSAPAGSGS